MSKRKKAIIIFCSAVVVLAVIINMVKSCGKSTGGIGSFSGKKIGLISIKGVIYESAPLIKLIKEYGEDDGIKAIIIRIDSPGGAVSPVQEIYEELNKVRTGKKKIYASLGSVSASGGYYLACAADKIYSNPGTITGSIGVIMEFPNIEELFKKIGIRFETIKSGEHKDIGSSFRKLTEEEALLLQDVIDDVHEQFVEAVAEGREKAIKETMKSNNAKAAATSDDVMEEVMRIADGRIFSGRQALDLGLVDELGNLQDTIDALAKDVGIEGEPELVVEKKKLGFFDLITESAMKKLGISDRASLGLSYIFK